MGDERIHCRAGSSHKKISNTILYLRGGGNQVKGLRSGRFSHKLWTALIPLPFYLVNTQSVE